MRCISSTQLTKNTNHHSTYNFREEITSKMYKIAAIIFIHLFHAIFAEPPLEVLNSSVKTEEQAAELLDEIQPEKVLPLVLFNVAAMTESVLRFPQDLNKAMILNGIMVEGTSFSMNASYDQMFFCPQPNSNEKCLAPEEFEESVPLRCAKEPNPVLRKDEKAKSCGFNKSGTLYDMIYEICPNDEEYSSENIPIFYELCYNTSTKRTLHTLHIIPSPLLLKSNLLLRERSVPYQFTENGTLKPLNFDGLKNPSKKNFHSLTHPNKPAYKLQQLVPDMGMAFALWRKVTYQDINLDWQHEKLIPLWNKINYYVNSMATDESHLKDTVAVHTTVTDIGSAFPDNTKISNIWVKVIIVKPFNPFMKSQGIAIFMNNFTANNPHGYETRSAKTEKAIESSCVQDLCVPSLVEEFKKVQGSVRCCSLTNKIGTLFGSQDIKNDTPVLFIPGITSKLSTESEMSQEPTEST